MENKKTFGEYFTQKRKEVGLTQRQVAERLFVTDSAVSKWERGKSYPDITLVHDICSVLQVSEHELLTASEDVKSRTDEKLATAYKKLQNKYKVAMYIVLGAIAAIGLISNLAVEHTLSWFFIVLAADIVAASLLLLPVFTEKNKGVITLSGFTLSVLLLMAVVWGYTGGGWLAATMVGFVLGMSIVFLPVVLRNIVLPVPLCNHKAALYLTVNSLLIFLMVFVTSWPQMKWFFTKGVPITTVCLLLPWLVLAVIRYTKINKYFKAASCLALTAVYTFYINGFIAWILGTVPNLQGRAFNFTSWDTVMQNDNINAMICFCLFGVGVLFAVAGIVYEIKTIKKV